MLPDSDEFTTEIEEALAVAAEHVDRAGPRHLASVDVLWLPAGEMTGAELEAEEAETEAEAGPGVMAEAEAAVEVETDTGAGPESAAEWQPLPDMQTPRYRPVVRHRAGWLHRLRSDPNRSILNHLARGVQVCTVAGGFAVAGGVAEAAVSAPGSEHAAAGASGFTGGTPAAWPDNCPPTELAAVGRPAKPLRSAERFVQRLHHPQLGGGLVATTSWVLLPQMPAAVAAGGGGALGSAPRAQASGRTT